MHTKNPVPANQKPPARSLQVRTGLQAGGWQCNDCTGKIMGNQLFKANCNYCQK